MRNMDYIEEKFVDIQDVKLHVIEAGNEKDPAVLLLHGFPEFWYGWRHQIPALVEAGFRVIVPDQRGYNLSGKPRGVRHYDMDILARDVIGLLDHYGLDRVYLAGHDWGAAVAWWAALHFPERFKKLAILNVPHPAVMKNHLLKNLEQIRKSWYIFFFQIPWLPELLLSRRGQAGAARLLRGSGLKGTFSAEDLKHYRQAWGQPGAWTGSINWYRALMRRTIRKRIPTRVETPTLILWGKQDAALSHEMAVDSLAYCEDGQLEMIERATHWVQHDAVEVVNQKMLSFFNEK